MRKQITIALLIMFVTAVSACSKDEGTHVDIVGIWKVSKVETTVAGSETVIYTGTSSDTMEFRRSDGNQMIVNLNSNNYIGNYAVGVNNDFSFRYNDKSRFGKITTITPTAVEFTVTVKDVSPETTEKYYLAK